jgi:translation elongation factor EF-4
VIFRNKLCIDHFLDCICTRKNVLYEIKLSSDTKISVSNRNEYQDALKIKKPVGKVRPARKADKLAAIY